MHHPGDGQAGDGGRLLAGRYRVIEQLGRGGMGVVCRAYDEVLGREVAVKELRTYADAAGPELADLRLRMQREARAAARVRHTGVIAVHDIAEHEGRPVIVMELVDGPSLDDVLREEGTLEPERAAAIGAKVLDALAAAHRAGVLHRDVKPGNILLERGGRVVLTDFGIAAVEDPGDGASAHLTRSGELVGSLDYLAPERARGEDPGPASDVWSLGATLYAAVEGGSPFRRTSTWSTLTAIVAEPLPEPRRAGPLEPALRALMAKDPERRADAAQAAAVLRQIAQGGAPAVPGTGGGTADTLQLGAVRGPRQGDAPYPPAAHPPVPGAPGQGRPAHAQATAGGPHAGGAFAAGRDGPGTDRGTDRSTLRTSAAGGPRRRRTAVAAAVAAVLLAGAGVVWAVAWMAPEQKGPAAAAGASPEAGTPAGSDSAGPGAGDASGKPDEGRSSPEASASADESAAPAGGDDGGSRDHGSSGGDSAAGGSGGSGSGGGGSGGGDDGSGGTGSGSGASGASGTTGSSGGGAPPQPACHPSGDGTYDCQVWRTAKSYNAQHQHVGTLYSGTNYFFCQAKKPYRETYGQWTNVWWAKTDDDSGNPGVWVSVVYIRGGDNDQPVPGLPTC